MLADGPLLGGVFTMLYSVGISLSGSRSLTRLVVVSIALTTTLAVGYLRFTRSTDAAALAAGARAGSGAATPADHEMAQLPILAERVTAVEATLNALSSALRRGQD